MPEHYAVKAKKKNNVSGQRACPSSVSSPNRWSFNFDLLEQRGFS